MFRFRLQRLLELRERHEQAKARDLATAQGIADEAARIHQTLQELRTDSKAQLDAAAVSEQRIGHLNQIGTTIDSLSERLLVATDAVAEANAGVHQAQERLMEAARNRRILDRLRHRQAEVWRMDENQRDRHQMDEVALIQYNRQHDTTRQHSDQKTTDDPQRGGPAQ